VDTQPVRASTLRDVRAAVGDASRRIDDPLGLERAVAGQLRRVVPFDLWCGLTTDPQSALPTGGYHEEGLPMQRMPHLVELENDARPDFVALRSLASAPSPAAALHDATEGDPARSRRYRHVLEPSGIRHELRAAFRGVGGTWGALVLMRGTDEPAFSADEVALVASVSGTVAEGLCRTTMLAAGPAPLSAGADRPGLLLCTVGARVTVDHLSEVAAEWLAEVSDAADEDGLPYAVAALVHAAHHQAQGDRRTRLRTRTGRWLTLHASRIGGTGVSVIMEPTRAADLADLFADAYRLTPRERDVAILAVRGRSNTQIGRALFLSPYTVNDHLKRVFDKVGVSSRAELGAKVAFAELPGAG
jgi:DNA-binding CsgD family transcriptional regulator